MTETLPLIIKKEIIKEDDDLIINFIILILLFIIFFIICILYNINYFESVCISLFLAYYIFMFGYCIKKILFRNL